MGLVQICWQHNRDIEKVASSTFRTNCFQTNTILNAHTLRLHGLPKLLGERFVPCMFPLGDPSGELMSAWASTHNTRESGLARSTPANVPSAIEWSPPRVRTNFPSAALAKTVSERRWQPAPTANEWCAFPPASAGSAPPGGPVMSCAQGRQQHPGEFHTSAAGGYCECSTSTILARTAAKTTHGMIVGGGRRFGN